MTITEELFSKLQDGQIGRIGEQLGIGQAEAQAAVAAALPFLVGALGRNAQQPEGARELLGALGRDHSGLDLGGVLGSVLGGGGQGGSILGHVFGQKQASAEQGLGAATGLGNERAGALLRLLAPVVMAFVAKQMFDRRQGAATPTPTDLSSMLGREQVQIAKEGGIGSKLLAAVLDRDKNGDVGLSGLAERMAGVAGAIAAGIGSSGRR